MNVMTFDILEFILFLFLLILHFIIYVLRNFIINKNLKQNAKK